MKILSIETSCDETAIAIVDTKTIGKKTKFKILGNEVSSQIALHVPYGGVFPSLAKREHQKNLPLVLEKALAQAKMKIEKIDLIAVTSGPGLEPALWTGIVFAKELSKKYKIPAIPVNHMEGHIFSVFPNNNKNKTFTVDKNKKIFPALSLLISGGHTELIVMKDWKKYKKIGKTRDDAVGEAFDKVARMLGLPYPGGYEITKLSEAERAIENSNFSRSGELEQVHLPRPMIHSKDYDFSFSGLKTAVLYFIRDLGIDVQANNEEAQKWRQKIAKEFSDSVAEVLVSKTIKAIKEYEIKTLIVGGGVSADTYIRQELEKAVKKFSPKTKVHFPSKGFSGDNALMIAVAGYFQLKDKKNMRRSSKIVADGNLSL